MKSATTTTLTVTSGGTSVASVTSGSVVTLTATVNAGGAAVRPGQVNFCDATATYCTDVHLLGTAQLTSGGTATVKIRPWLGSHSFKAIFAGTDFYAGSSSSASGLTVTGSLAPTAGTTTIVETGSWGSYALTGTVTEVGNTAAPTGTVSFLDSNNANAVLGQGSLGTATAGLGWLTKQSSWISNGISGVVADFNGDGIPDIAESTGEINILLGNGDGSFTVFGTNVTQRYEAGATIAVGDFNNDGIPDLVVISPYSSTATILLGKGDGTFTQVTTQPSVGTQASGIAVADFNGDGKLDLAITNSNVSGNSTITILLGNGDGTFSAASQSPSAGSGAYAIVAGDFNGDGKTDLAVTAQQTDSLTILLGNGDGTFTAAASPQVTSIANAIAAADFNGDGKLDLIVACGNGGLVVVLLGNGDGTFTAAPSFPAAVSDPTVIVVGDFNQDGIADVGLLNNTYTAGGPIEFLGKGDGTFTQVPGPPQMSIYSGFLVGGDFNGDGRTDLAIPGSGSGSQNLVVYLTEPTETASATSNVTVSGVGQHLVDASYAGDVNYTSGVSGTTPLWGAQPATATTLALSANGSPATSVAPGTPVTLTATVAVGASPVTIGQVNFCDASAPHCTDIDLLGTAALTSSGTSTFKFVPGAGAHSYKAVFVENGYGLSSSSNPASLTVGPAPSPVYADTTSISFSGFPGDYTLTSTVVGFGGTAAPTGNVSFLDTSFGNATLATSALGTGTPGLGWLISQTPALSYPPAVEVAGDFNGDGIPDVALLWTTSIFGGSPYSVTIFFGAGNGTFTTGPTTVATGVQSYPYMMVGDFNGDGKTDLAILSSNGSSTTYVTVMPGNGDGTFAASETSQAYNQGAIGGDDVPGSMVAADFNGDGKLDLAVVGGVVASGEVTILLGNGDGTFTSMGTSYGNASSFNAIATGDFNGDGIPDLVVSNYFSPSGATVLLGKGDGTFTALPAQLPVDSFAHSIVVGDFNSDGLLDLAFGYDGAIGVYLGNGDGTFKPAAGSPVSGAGLSLVAGDFNHDGKLDLAGIDNYNNQIDLFLGYGDGTFKETVTTPNVSQSFLGPFAIVAADFNSDGVPDLAMLTKNQATVSILITEPTETATATVTGIAPVGAGTHNVEASYAGDSNYGSSVSATITLTAGLTPVVISPASGTYTSVQTVTMSESIPGATIYYWASGTYNTNGFVQYTGPISLTIGGTETIQAYATETGYQQSNFTNAAFTLSFPIAPPPVISPTGGSFAGPQSVAITDSVAGAIYFTTDGTYPTLNSAVYTGPITVSTSETIAAIAVPSGYSPSNVASAQFFIGSSQSSFIYTIAGNESWGYAGDSGPATLASLNDPIGTAVDSAGNLYIADGGNNVVRKVAAGSGLITTVAGTGVAGYSGDNGPATGAQLYFLNALAIDGAGNLYIADAGNRVVRMVAAGTGMITTVAGSTSATSLGDNGPATSAQLSHLEGLAVDSSGNLYIADQQRVRKVTASTGTITTFAGTANYGYAGDNGPATSATLGSPFALAVDASGNLYIADAGNNAIRKVAANTGIITTVAGAGPTYTGSTFGGDGGPATSAHLYGPQGIAVDAAGDLYISDTYNSAVREVTASNGIINTIVGHPPSSCNSLNGDGGPAIESAICYPSALTLDSTGNLYISESGSSRIRKMTAAMPPPTTATAAPVFNLAPGSYASSPLVSISSATPGAEIYLTLNGSAPTTTGEGYHGPITVTGTVTMQAVAVAPGFLPSASISAGYAITTPPAATVSTVAGNGTYGMLGAGGPATSAELRSPNGVALDSAGNLYIADGNSSVVWMVAAATGTISVAAGTPGTFGSSGNGGLATSAYLNYPARIAFDSAGNMYIADSGNNVVSKVDAQTGIIAAYAGGGGYSTTLGDGGPATSAMLFGPEGLAFDSGGNLYIADTYNARIRMVSASTGIISTVAGGATNGALGDGGPATSATLSYPQDLALDSQGNLYIADQGHGRIRVVNASTKLISTLAGNGNRGESGDGGPATTAEVAPNGIALDGAGNLYIANQLDAVRMVPAGGGAITTVAGSGYAGFGGDGGSATMAEFCDPQGLAFDHAGNLYIADWCNYRVRKVTFSGAAATPSFSLAPGTYKSAQTVTITDETPGALIYYTTDGSTPANSSTLYSGPMSVSSTETVNAIAVATGYKPSAVASASYVINNVPIKPAITWAAPAPVTYGTPLSSAQLNATTTIAGSFAYSPSAGTVLNAGQQTLSVTFTPTDTTDYTTSSASVTLTVNQAAASVSAVASSLNPSMASSSVTFTATVTSPVGTPSGTIAFMDGSTQLGSGTLSSGTATYSTSSLSAGSHSVTAVYPGDSNFESVTSSALTQIVESFSIGISNTGSSSATVSPGGQASFALVATPPSAGSALTFAVTGLPAGATGTFSPSTVAAGSGPTNVTLTVSVPATSGMLKNENPLRQSALPMVLGLILLPIAGRLRKVSGRLRWLVSLWMITLAAACISACGGSGSKSTSNPQTYTLTVTAASGSLTQTTKLTLTVE